MLKTIKQIVEEEFQLENIEQRTRKHPYPEARAVYYSISKETTPQFSYDSIANFVGRDQSTAMHAIRKLKDTYLREAEFRNIHQKIKDRVNKEVEEKKKRFFEIDKC